MQSKDRLAKTKKLCDNLNHLRERKLEILRHVVSLADSFFVDGGNRGGDAGEAKLGLSFITQ